MQLVIGESNHRVAFSKKVGVCMGMRLLRLCVAEKFAAGYHM